MSDRIDRRQLRTDSFAVAVEQNVDYVANHKRQFILYGAIALAVILLAVGIFYYRRHQHQLRQEALGDAIQTQETSVTPGATPGPLSFPTDQAKRDAATKAFSGVVSRFPGSDEASIAEYYLGSIAADAGRLDEARKRFQQVADNADKQYASLAKLSLADTDIVEGKGAEAEKVLRDLMEHPTVFVSKEQATITLARYYVTANRDAEARKLLQPLTASPNAASQAAVQMLGELKK